MGSSCTQGAVYALAELCSSPETRRAYADDAKETIDAGLVPSMRDPWADPEEGGQVLFPAGLDGWPIVLPTPGRVERMRPGTRREAAEWIGLMPPTEARARVEALAMHAVMAGCLPTEGGAGNAGKPSKG
jgi:hypothetical protein